MGKEPRICLNCGKHFIGRVTKYRIRKFCCKKCFDIYRTDRNEFRCLSTDMVNKGRTIGNVKQKPKIITILKKRAKLTKENVIEIKKLIEQGMIIRKIAKIFNTHPNTIGAIKQGKHWKHIK